MPATVLVINLTRFGDLLQSQAVIDDLHQAGLSVNLVCLDNFAAALPLLRNVQKTWQLPGSRLLSLLDKSWPEALALVQKFAAGIRAAGEPDYILNLTPTLPCRLLTRMLTGSDTKVAGFDLDVYGYGVNHGVWASFFAVAAAKRANSPFNLADMMRRLADGIVEQHAGTYSLNPPGSEIVARVGQYLAKASGGGRGYIALQLGASEERRRWPIANFRELGRMLWEKTGLVPVLLGSQSEAGLGEKFAEGCEYPFINAIGQTDLEELAGLLMHSRLLVTNDTGTMHLAAGLNRPVLALFLATAQPQDTGPLSEGSLSLEPALDCHPCAFDRPCEAGQACRQKISADAVFAYALAFLEEGDFSKGAKAANSACARAWLTRSNGFVRLEPISESAAAGGPQIWQAWLRRFWEAFLSEAASKTVGPEPDYAGLPKPECAASCAEKLRQAASLLDVLRECGGDTKGNPGLGKILLRNCERLQAQLDNSEELATLAGFWRELKLNQGDDMGEFLGHAATLARHLRLFADALLKARVLHGICYQNGTAESSII